MFELLVALVVLATNNILTKGGFRDLGGAQAKVGIGSYTFAHI